MQQPVSQKTTRTLLPTWKQLQLILLIISQARPQRREKEMPLFPQHKAVCSFIPERQGVEVRFFCYPKRQSRC